MSEKSIAIVTGDSDEERLLTQAARAAYNLPNVKIVEFLEELREDEHFDAVLLGESASKNTLVEERTPESRYSRFHGKYVVIITIGRTDNGYHAGSGGLILEGTLRGDTVEDVILSNAKISGNTTKLNDNIIFPDLSIPIDKIVSIGTYKIEKKE